ncbi:Zn finger-containing GTPase- Activating Protein for ARF [Tulasnella sp. 417]|nr:Zn finger-containing GTPase- Activating Protein for ARF [Tulasnella sp. 417]
MDTWKEDQLRKMRLGGNLPFKAFMKAYPPEGGYTPGMPPAELYHTWAASQYREKANAARPAGLPPSQGGRYEGFGSTPTPEPASQHPSYGLSSANAPTFEELQRDPMAALSKGWSLFAAVAAGAGRAVNENLIQPGMEKAMDPTLRATAAGYVSQASQKAAEVAAGANDWSKNQFGVDVAGKARETFMGPSTRGTYSTVESHSGNDWDKYNDDDDDDFFERELAASKSDQPPKSSQPASATATAPASKKPAAQDDDDDWKDF